MRLAANQTLSFSTKQATTPRVQQNSIIHTRGHLPSSNALPSSRIYHFTTRLAFCFCGRQNSFAYLATALARKDIVAVHLAVKILVHNGGHCVGMGHCGDCVCVLAGGGALRTRVGMLAVAVRWRFKGAPAGSLGYLASSQQRSFFFLIFSLSRERGESGWSGEKRRVAARCASFTREHSPCKGEAMRRDEGKKKKSSSRPAAASRWMRWSICSPVVKGRQKEREGRVARGGSRRSGDGRLRPGKQEEEEEALQVQVHGTCLLGDSGQRGRYRRL